MFESLNVRHPKMAFYLEDVGLACLEIVVDRFTIFRCPGRAFSGCLDLQQMSRFLDFQISRFPDFQLSRRPDFFMSRFIGVESRTHKLKKS